MPREGGLGELGGQVGASSGDSLLHRNFPFRIELHFKLHQAGGVDSIPSVWGLGSQPFELRRGRGEARDNGEIGTYILSRNVLRGALAVIGCLARARTSSAQSYRTQSPEVKFLATCPPEPLGPGL